MMADGEREELLPMLPEPVASEQAPAAAIDGQEAPPAMEAAQSEQQADEPVQLESLSDLSALTGAAARKTSRHFRKRMPPPVAPKPVGLGGQRPPPIDVAPVQASEEATPSRDAAAATAEPELNESDRQPVPPRPARPAAAGELLRQPVRPLSFDNDDDDDGGDGAYNNDRLLDDAGDALPPPSLPPRPPRPLRPDELLASSVTAGTPTTPSSSSEALAADERPAVPPKSPPSARGASSQKAQSPFWTLTRRESAAKKRPQLSGPLEGRALSPSSSPGAATLARVASSSGSLTDDHAARRASLVALPDDARTKVARELYNTEATFVATLDTIIAVFLQPLRQSGDILSDRELVTIFGNVEALRDFSASFLAALEERLSRWSADKPEEHLIGQTFLDFAPRFPAVFQPYYNGFNGALAELVRLEKKKKEFKDFLDEAFLNPRCSGLRLNALLLTPIQRIPRYMLLFRELVDKTDSAHADTPPLREALQRSQDLAELVNRGVMETESNKKLSDLKRHVTGLQSLASPSRTLVKEGPVCLTTPKKPYKMLLFNDLLVFAAKDDTKSDVELVLPLDCLWYEDLEDLDPQTTLEDAFEVYTPERPYTIYAGSNSAKKVWLNTLRKVIATLLGVAESSIETREHVSYKYRDGSEYEGGWLEGQRHGRGRLTLPSRTVYDGEWAHDARSGTGAMMYSTGEVYEGDWKEGKPHGRGILALVDGNKYSGEWRYGRKNGAGTLYFANGDIFEGTFEDDHICGHGRLACANGAEYVGQWSNSQWNGKGTLKVNGQTYIGEFRANYKEGYGEMTYADGAKFAGEWRQDKRHGRGVLSGAREPEHYDGRWFSDQRDGAGRQTYINGDVYDGEFSRDLRHGRGTLTYASGGRYDGQWELDLFHGRGALVDANGDAYDGGWARGLREGAGVQTRVDGSVYEGAFRADKREGMGILRLPDGTTYEGQFANDKRHGLGTFTSNEVKYHGEWAFDKKEGKGVLVTEAGRFEGYFKDDKRHGQGMFTSLIGTRFDGAWILDAKNGKGVITYPHGHYDIIAYRNNAPLELNPETVAPELPSIPRPGVNC